MKKQPKFNDLLSAEIQKDINGNSVELPEIVDTVDHELIHYLPQNRPLNATHINKMGESVTKLSAILRLIILVEINFKYYIADGQHLYEYCKRVGLKMRYMIYHAKTFEEAFVLVTTMNSTSENWSLARFAKQWVWFRPEYKSLLYINKQYRIPYSVLGALLANTDEQTAKKQIKDGTFRIDGAEQRVKNFLRAIDNFFNTTGVERYSHTIGGLVAFMRNIGIDEYVQNERVFLSAVSKYHKKYVIAPFARKVDALSLFNRIYGKE